MKFFYHKGWDFSPRNWKCWLSTYFPNYVIFLILFSSWDYSNWPFLKIPITLCTTFILSGVWQNALFLPTFLGNGHSEWFLWNSCIIIDFFRWLELRIKTQLSHAQFFYIDSILISDLRSRISARKSFCVLVYLDRAWFLSTHVIETFVKPRIKVTWMKNKRKLDDWSFYLFRQVAYLSSINCDKVSR